MDDQMNEERHSLPAPPQDSSCQKLWGYPLPFQPMKESGGRKGASRGL